MRKNSLAILSILFWYFLLAGEARSASDWTRVLGEATKEAFALQYGLCENPLLKDWVARIGEKLSKSAGMKVEFYIVDTDEVNAYATFGDMVFLTKGLLKIVESEDELACVLAHEVAHLKLKHPQRQSIAIALSLLLLSSLDLRGEREILARFLLALANLGFSRGQEKEADITGIEIAFKSGYNPRGFLSFFKRLGGEKSPRWMEYLATHPSPYRRLEICWEKISELPKDQWERIYGSLWERGEAGEAREFPQFQPQPPAPREFHNVSLEDKDLTALWERLHRIYPLSQTISQCQVSLLLAEVPYELFPLIGEAIAQSDRLKELYSSALLLYNNVNVLSEKLEQKEFAPKILGMLIPALDKGEQAGERLLLASASLVGLAFSKYIGDLPLLSLQAILLASGKGLAEARIAIEKVNDALLPRLIESLVGRLNVLDNEWLRRKCSHRLGMRVGEGMPLGDFCLLASISLSRGTNIEEVKKIWSEVSGVEEMLMICNLVKRDKEAIFIFLDSLTRGN